jgi:hypothetical protein
MSRWGLPRAVHMLLVRAELGLWPNWLSHSDAHPVQDCGLSVDRVSATLLQPMAPEQPADLSGVFMHVLPTWRCCSWSDICIQQLQ